MSPLDPAAGSRPVVDPHVCVVLMCCTIRERLQYEEDTGDQSQAPWGIRNASEEFGELVDSVQAFRSLL